MTITVAHTSATVADIAGFTALAPMTRGASEVVVVARPTSVRRRRPLIVPRRHRAAAASVAVSASSDLVEVTVVRSPRNRVGGGARARPTTTW